MPTPFSGGCACGAVRYDCSAEPLLSFNCHCRDCQRTSGSAFALVLMVPTGAFTITKGTPRYYRVTGGSGNAVDRGFCPGCGASVFITEPKNPQFTEIQAASLDDPSWVQPMIDIFTARAQPWDYLNPALPKFAMQPTMEQWQELLAKHKK
jgi:hypothetical protein